jgi:phospholipid/cholesterol/gamma-HCH transport system substrate-binding protein
MSDDAATPPPTRTRDQALWVGLFIILGLLATLGVLFTMTDAAFFRGRYIVSTYVRDAGGIRRGDPVQMRGVNVGRIESFAIEGERVQIRLELEGEYPVPKDSRVHLKSAGMLGGVIADVIPGTSQERARYGDTLQGTSEEAMASATQRIIEEASGAINRVDRLLSDKLIADVGDSGAELRSALTALSATIKEQRGELRTIEASLRKNAQSLEKVTGAPELERSVKRLDEITARFDTVAQSLDRSSKSAEDMLARLERGDGTLGKLTKDEALYQELRAAAASINQAGSDLSTLIEDIRKNPKKYLKFSVF